MTSERRKPYPFDSIEPKWQRRWDETQVFRAPNPGEKNFDPARPKFYILDMFPYPSGTGLHVGHPEGYTATDIIARYQRMRGRNVLHPMGWDAFGLPAEQYAIKTGQHPAVTTRENIAKFKAQLKRIGFSYDWSREINTTDPAYYKWTQWIFLQIYHSWFNSETQRAEPIATYRGADPDAVRLAYVADVRVNWCPELGTVLANEEVIDGKSEVGGFPVVRRPMRQWMLRITAFAERLIDELDGLDWPEGIKLLQRNWIGKSEGAEIEFSIAAVAGRGSQTMSHSAAASDRGDSGRIRVFTTRPDTIYGATYMVLAPEHPLVDEIATAEQKSAIEKYRVEISAKSDLERTDLAKDKSGVFTGAFAINPANGKQIPIWIADYVLMTYGTGAIMAVPAHDERDLEFAGKFELPIREVVRGMGSQPMGHRQAAKATPEGFTGEGVAINSPLIDGLATSEAKVKIIAWLEENSQGRRDIRYKLRDWLFSRQRYWGEPFPIVWEKSDPDGRLKHRSLGESELPLEPPPLDDFKPTGTGDAPLAKAKDWIGYSEKATRETNTMPQWAGSCWYYLRFCDPTNATRFVGQDAEKYWMAGNCDTSARAEWLEQLRDLYLCSKDKRVNRKAFVNFGRVGVDEARKIEEATGLRTVGFRRFIDVFALRHIDKRYGPKHEESSELVIDLNDLALIPEIVCRPDAIHSGGKSNLGLPTIRYEKRIANTICYVEEVLLGRQLLSAKTMFKKVATASRAPEGLAHTSETLRRTNPNFADVSGSRKSAPPGGVDLYVGGTEHAVLHLLYARFWHKVLFDLGFVSTPEPFQRLVNQGLILGEDGQKMSKSRGNVVNPDDVIALYGADALRCYEMFMGPLEQMKPWSMRGVEGIARFLARVWRLVMEENQTGEWALSSRVETMPLTAAEEKVLHATIRKVTEDIESLSFNTAISQMMIFVNAFTNSEKVPVLALRTFLLLLNPFAPHLSSELWEKIAGEEELTAQPWPEYDPAKLIEREVEIAVQVNGKVREKLRVALEATEEAIQDAALSLPRIQELIAGKQIRKVVVVPKKLVNIVLS